MTRPIPFGLLSLALVTGIAIGLIPFAAVLLSGGFGISENSTGQTAAGRVAAPNAAITENASVPNIPTSDKPRTSPSPQEKEISRLEAAARKAILDEADDPHSVEFAKFAPMGLIGLGVYPVHGPYYGLAVRYREKNPFGALQLRERVVVFAVEGDKILDPEPIAPEKSPVISTSQIAISTWGNASGRGGSKPSDLRDFFDHP